jgi:hypothetical protein
MGDDGEAIRIGPYRLLGEIGRGDTGVVHLAVDARRPGSAPVAVKRLWARADDESRRRLRRDASVVSTLGHPSIVRVIEVLDDGTGVAIVMQHASGGSLLDRLRADHVVPAHAVADLIAPIAEALDAMHRHGIVHGDVEPSSILFDAEGRPVLAGFGTSRMDGGTGPTRPDTALGPVAYLAPEVADGAGHSPATDLYGLGVTAYEALTGSPPFRGPTPLAIIRAADRGEFEPLDRARFGAMAAVVERAMARQPERRHPDARTFAEELRRAVAAPPAFTTPWRRALPEAVDAGDRATDRRDDTFDTPAARPANAGEPAATIAPGRRERPAPLPVATDRPRRRVPRSVPAAAGALALGLAAIAVSARDEPAGSAIVAFRPACTATATVRCLERIDRAGSTLVVSFTDGSDVVRISLTDQERADVAIAGNWFCGPTETLALYRPGDGTIRYFRDWPTRAGEDVASVGDRTGVVAGTVEGVGDRNGDGCSDVALRGPGGDRTWFLPVAQPERLERLS